MVQATAEINLQLELQTAGTVIQPHAGEVAPLPAPAMESTPGAVAVPEAAGEQGAVKRLKTAEWGAKLEIRRVHA